MKTKELHFKAILRYDKANSNGTPIYTRSTLHRKRSLQSTGYYVTDEKKQWNESAGLATDNHPQAKVINTMIVKRKSDADAEYANHIAAGTSNSVDVHVVVKKKLADTVWIDNDRNLYSYIDERVVAIRRAGSVKEVTIERNYNPMQKILKHFYGDKLMMSQLSPEFFEKLVGDMREAGYKSGYILKTIKNLSKFTNIAFNGGLIKKKPFAGCVRPKQDKSSKERLTMAEQDKLEKYAESLGCIEDDKSQYDPLGNGRKQAAIYFLLGCCTGLRWSDWSKFNPKIHCGKKGIKSLRAKKNDNLCAVPYHPRLLRVIEMVKKTKLTIPYNIMLEQIKNIEKDLKFGKNLSTHCGRKTFAVTVCSEYEIAPETCAEMMGISLRTCLESYYEVTENRVIREAEEKWKNME